ncbi:MULTISPECIES: hypothetical protein [unclassified Nocardioides]|uniref:hypothetical protein n=1 Tax=unclassified Nocardioides TaxID=2615069 RepID=UPI0006F7D73A|nr:MULTISPECIES: hypothetical protein [unclassified Nocardioides]KQY50242.1 hypothetical protein ASD30_22280 [Nocardioides sp. Root140]KQZ75867.1 hypothetical protein ASD66_06015 [Nocardioides sp. Root151]KRF14938.1 hypothetical protein ASH02_11795 [Nocardioides sp. Soil796]
MSDEEEVEATLSVGARFIGDPESLHVVALGGEKPGMFLELVDFSQPQAAEDDEDWNLDPSSDLGLKVTMAGLDPEVAVQLLKVAAEFLEQAEFEEG